MAKWGTVDIRELKKLQKRLEQFEKVDMEKFQEQMVKELAARMLAKVIPRTPVGVYPPKLGKVGGTLRRGWTIGQVIRNGDTYEIEVVNPVDYSSYVEYGHRTKNHKGWVKGRFMMTLSAQELEREAPKIIERALEKKLREAFGDDK